MSWSLGETSALAVKAARGCGMSWGLADEAGYAVRWLQARALPGVAALCCYLNWRASGKLVDWPAEVGATSSYCPIQTGTALADGGITLDTQFSRVQNPLLMLPFIALRAGSNVIRIELDKIRIDVNQMGAGCSHNKTAILVQNAICTLSTDPSDMLPITYFEAYPLPRVPSDATCCMNTLGRFAAKTYAPSTEQSRLRGAGAGLTDND